MTLTRIHLVFMQSKPAYIIFFLLFHDILNKLYKRVTRIAIWNNCFSSCFQCCYESKSIYCPLNVSADLNNERLSYELCCIYYSNIFTRYSFLLT